MLKAQPSEDQSSDLVFFISSPFASENVNKVLGHAGYSHRILADKLIEFINFRYRSEFVQNDSEVKAKILARNRTDELYFFIYVGPPEDSWLSSSCLNLILLTWEFPDFPEQEICPVYQNWTPVLKKFDCVLLPNEMLAGRLLELRVPFLFFPFGYFISRPNTLSKNEAYEIVSGVTGLSLSGSNTSVTAEKQNEMLSKTIKQAFRVLHILTRTYSRLRLRRMLSQKLHGYFRDLYFRIAKTQNDSHKATSSGFIEFENLALELYGKTVIASWLNISDNRKNFETIVLSFMQMFGSQKNLVLLIKVIGDERELQKAKSVIDRLKNRFSEKKRFPILLLSGSHTENELHGIQKITDIYLNASSAEGICLPAIEHFQSGATLVIPNNSAFKDYFSPDEVFFFDVDTLPTHFPGDPREIFLTTWSPPVFSNLVRNLGFALEEVLDINSTRKNFSDGWKESGDDFYASLRKLHGNS